MTAGVAILEEMRNIDADMDYIISVHQPGFQSYEVAVTDLADQMKLLLQYGSGNRFRRVSPSIGAHYHTCWG